MNQTIMTWHTMTDVFYVDLKGPGSLNCKNPIPATREKTQHSVYCVARIHSAKCQTDNISFVFKLKGDFFNFFLFMYGNQPCFICRPSYSTVSEDAEIEPRTPGQLRQRHWLSDALNTRLDLIHIQAHSPPETSFCISAMLFECERVEGTRNEQTSCSVPSTSSCIVLSTRPYSKKQAVISPTKLFLKGTVS